MLYVAGHNVIIFNPEESSQYFIPGSENVEAINFITISPAKKFLAICERGEIKAQFTIFNLQTRKRQKVISLAELTEYDLKAKEFLGVAFCPKDEKRHIVTLCGEPDWCVLLWQHDVFKMLARINLSISDPIANTFQISEFNVSTHLVVAVTGPQCFNFMKINDNNLGFTILKD